MAFTVNYSNSLSTLLSSEQYELFLKFNHDQLRRKFDAEMSDCSCENFVLLPFSLFVVTLSILFT